MTDSTLEVELSEWCQSYVTAFSAYDVSGIEDHWAFPALIIHGRTRMVFKSAEHFSRNTSALLSFYKRQGVVRADRKLVSCLMMNSDVAAMTVSDRMIDAAEQEIVSWRAAYVLQRIDGGWRAVSAVADGEGAAWKARGTPLGS